MPISGNNKKKWLYLFLLTGFAVYSQTRSYNQFWNEYSFTDDISSKWAFEWAGGFRTSDVPDSDNPMSQIIRIYGRAGFRYYTSTRWKLGAYYWYIFNRDVPELSQEKAPEMRMTLQANYALLRKRFKTNLRGTIEDRHLKNSERNFESVTRFRIQAKAVYPLTAPVIKDNVLYGFVSDEVMFKTKSSVSGNTFFDRNRVNAGLGYSFINDFQVEVSYLNDYLPRPHVTKVYHAAQVNVIFTNIFHDLKKKKNRHEKTAIEAQ